VADMVDLVTPEGEVVGSAPRSSVHGDPELLHPVVHVLIWRPGGGLLLQRRSANKDTWPGLWASSVGGHVDSGERPEDAVYRELQEELGLRLRLRFCYRYLYRDDFESELVHTWDGTCDSTPTPAPDEIAEVRCWQPAEIDAALGSGVFTPTFEVEWRHYCAHIERRQ